MACVDGAWLQARIDKTQTRIEAYEDALDALADPTIQTFDLDTGQTRQRVTRHDIDMLEANLDRLYNRYATLCARMTGSHVTQVIPCF